MPSFNAHLGLRAGVEPGTVTLETRPEHEVMPGTIHFAVLTTLAEVAAAGAANAAVVPTALSLQLLRRARPGKLEGRGRVLKSGRTLIFAEGEVHQDGELVAKASVTFARL
jgi:acyl-coenzyme A thioesterase PaaI-like protein